MPSWFKYLLTSLATLGLGALCIWWWSPAAPPADSSAEEVARLQRAVMTLERRLEGLQQQQEAQAEQLQRLKVSPAAQSGSTRAPAPNGSRVVATTRDDVDEARQEQVKALVRDELAIAREDDWQQRLSNAKARVKRRVDSFADASSLNEEQADALYEQLSRERVALMELRRTFRHDGGDPADFAERIRSLRASTDARVAELLDEAQLTEYKSQRQREEARFNRRFER